MAMKTGGSDELNSDINVTPMVDVMLALLVIFMITAPLLNAGVNVELPQVVSKNVDDPNAPLVLTIDPKGHLQLGTTPVKWVELTDKLKANAKVQADKQLFVQADKSLPYEVVATALAVAQDAGVTHVMALTSPEETMKLDELDKGAL